MLIFVVCACIIGGVAILVYRMLSNKPPRCPRCDMRMVVLVSNHDTLYECPKCESSIWKSDLETERG